MLASFTASNSAKDDIVLSAPTSSAPIHPAMPSSSMSVSEVSTKKKRKKKNNKKKRKKLLLQQQQQKEGAAKDVGTSLPLEEKERTTVSKSLLMAPKLQNEISYIHDDDLPFAPRLQDPDIPLDSSLLLDMSAVADDFPLNVKPTRSSTSRNKISREEDSWCNSRDGGANASETAVRTCFANVQLVSPRDFTARQEQVQTLTTKTPRAPHNDSDISPRISTSKKRVNFCETPVLNKQSDAMNNKEVPNTPLTEALTPASTVASTTPSPTATSSSHTTSKKEEGILRRSSLKTKPPKEKNEAIVTPPLASLVSPIPSKSASANKYSAHDTGIISSIVAPSSTSRTRQIIVSDLPKMTMTSIQHLDKSNTSVNDSVLNDDASIASSSLADMVHRIDPSMFNDDLEAYQKKVANRAKTRLEESKKLLALAHKESEDQAETIRRRNRNRRHDHANDSVCLSAATDADNQSVTSNCTANDEASCVSNSSSVSSLSTADYSVDSNYSRRSMASNASGTSASRRRSLQQLQIELNSLSSRQQQQRSRLASSFQSSLNKTRVSYRLESGRRSMTASDLEASKKLLPTAVSMDKPAVDCESQSQQHPKKKKYPSCIYILLLQPAKKLFEVVPIDFDRELTVGDVLCRVRTKATDSALATQNYVSLCNAEQELAAPMLHVRHLLSRATNKCLLTAVPEGSNATICRKITHVLLQNPKIRRWLHQTNPFQMKQKQSSSSSVVSATSSVGSASVTSQRSSQTAPPTTSAQRPSNIVPPTARSKNRVTSSGSRSATRPKSFQERQLVKSAPPMRLSPIKSQSPPSKAGRSPHKTYADDDSSVCSISSTASLASRIKKRLSRHRNPKHAEKENGAVSSTSPTQRPRKPTKLSPLKQANKLRGDVFDDEASVCSVSSTASAVSLAQKLLRRRMTSAQTNNPRRQDQRSPPQSRSRSRTGKLPTCSSSSVASASSTPSSIARRMMRRGGRNRAEATVPTQSSEMTRS